MSRVLVVDDEPDLASLLEHHLKSLGIVVDVAARGAQALVMAHANPPDIAILDVMLPDLSGYEVCRAFRASPTLRNVLVLMLTARASEEDRVAGFECGADDYVTKPFNVRELTLRIQALLRRIPASGVAESGKMLRCGSVTLDLDAHRCLIDEVEVELTPIEFRLMAYFLTKVGQLVSRNTLLTDVWGFKGELETRTVDTHMMRLREKLRGARGQLQTVRGFGYRFVERQS